MTNNKERNERVINLIRSTIREQEPDAEIILYGSRARGDARDDSDWDVVVLLDRDWKDVGERGNFDYDLWTKGMDIGEEINTREYTKKQWNSLPPSMFKYNVINEGVIL